jgi:universal stress protein A
MKIKPTTRPGRVVMELDRRDEWLLESSAKTAAAAPFKLKEILVPIDFSESSLKALQYALPMAEKFGAHITLFHVIEPRFGPADMMAPAEILEVEGDLVRAGWQKLELLCHQSIKPAITSSSLVEMGRPYEEIVAAAKTHKTDLIIIATHGHTGLKHFFIGSTAERVVRHAPCPVLTVREREHDFVLS